MLTIQISTFTIQPIVNVITISLVFHKSCWQYNHEDVEIVTWYE